MKYKIMPSTRVQGKFMIMWANYTGWWVELYPGRDMDYTEAVGLLPIPMGG